MHGTYHLLRRFVEWLGPGNIKEANGGDSDTVSRRIYGPAGRVQGKTLDVRGKLGINEVS